MDKHFFSLHPLLLLCFTCCGLIAAAQENSLQYVRPNNRTGVSSFETSKTDTVPFTKTHISLGGNFEQSFQTLRDRNTAEPATQPGFTGNVNSLTPLTNGFGLAMANMNIDAQLADGIRVNLTTYLASRHHEDAWVKGGYIQFDKLLFLHSKWVDKVMQRTTIKMGQFDVDYGDQHYRRTDGGNTIYNPFIENYIMDEFATEIGAEVYYHFPAGWLLMAGVSNGALNPTVIAATKIDSATGKTNRYEAAFHGKAGYDRQLNKDLRVRLTGSFYLDKSANSNTLFGGDRTGSHYFNVMSNSNIANGTTLNNAYDYNAFSGRYNPGFSEAVYAYMINPFIKYKGLEFFAAGEYTKGRTITESALRRAVQYAADLLYRFPEGKENFWIGFRYNTVTAAMKGAPDDITIRREAGSAGWFITNNILLKVEYVNQDYLHYPATNILNGGHFNGMVAEASVAF